ncbi:MAG: helix-turn-helix transcriptional regulator [Pseudomonadota bacterium]|nr:helix-turn-helix transcriptional regulator [Pseudomonadota bacterium]
MASRPSDPLLAFLRDAIRKKGLNTAELAVRTGLDRARLKHRLAGNEDLTVDDLIALSKALELTPAELGLAGVDGADTPIDTLIEAPVAPLPGPDPFGNLSRQVVEHGFALGVDLFFVLDTPQLAGSGIPRQVLEEQREQLRLRMDARWFPQNKARFLDEALVCMLSFDSLYECTLPWSAFRSVTFLLPAEAHIPQSPEPPAPPRPAAPFLRIVK